MIVITAKTIWEIIEVHPSGLVERSGPMQLGGGFKVLMQSETLVLDTEDLWIIQGSDGTIWIYARAS